MDKETALELYSKGKMSDVKFGKILLGDSIRENCLDAPNDNSNQKEDYLPYGDDEKSDRYTPPAQNTDDKTLNKEQIYFIKNLSHEMKIQDNRGTASPYSYRV